MIITVKSGDTVNSLSREYGVLPDKIIADNGLPENGELVVGQSLVILRASRVYDASVGESVNSVSQMYDIPVRTIYRNNIFLGGKPQLDSNSQIVLEYEEKPSLRRFIGGYAYEFISQDLLDKVIPYMTYLMPFTYGFTPDGELIYPEDDRLIETAKRSGSRVLMHLSTLTENGNFSNELANILLLNPEATENLINNSVENVIDKGYDGIDIDFEFLFREDRERYVSFIRRMTEEMNRNGFICVVAVPPKVSDEQMGLLYEGVDYAGLGEAADYVLTMTYEWGYRFGPPLAVAPVPNVRRVLDYAVSRIPPEKLILGISNYGYDWTLPFVKGESDAPSLSYEEALSLARRYNAEIIFDEEAKAPFFYYTDENGNEHVVWFEDARSFEAKVELIEEYNLSGGFIWDLMRENPQGYVTLNSLIDIE